MRDRFLLENAETLMFFPDCYKNKQLCNKAVDNYSHTLEFVPDCFNIQNMCNKSHNTYPSAM